MNTPLITVAMPVFNAGQYLKPALLSIINQTYSNWQLLIMDDGSTDGCFDNLSELSDSRIRLIRDGENKGIAVRLNQAIALSQGELFARMDSDDISHPQRFEQQVKYLQDNAQIDLVGVRALRINQQGKVTGSFPFRATHDEICAKPWLGFYLAHPTWMGRLEWFKKYQYTIPQSYYSEDYDLLLRSYQFSQFACLPETIFSYRMKNKIKFYNQFKTRRAILKLQVNFFYKQAEYFYLVLSVMTFILKLLLDLVNQAKQSYRTAGLVN